MTNPLDYIRQRPKLAKQLIGLSLPQLEKLIQQVIATDEERKKEAEKLSTFETVELSVREHLLETVAPEVGNFFFNQREETKQEENEK